MDRQELLNFVAPCSLLCYTCTACKDGPVVESAKTLLQYLDGYLDFKELTLPEQFRWMMSDLEIFMDKLESFASRQCNGCRAGASAAAGCVPGCVVPDCAKSRNVDFCAECADFPCTYAQNFLNSQNRPLAKDWEQGTQRLREVGLEQYFEERKCVSHHASYKKG